MSDWKIVQQSSITPSSHWANVHPVQPNTGTLRYKEKEDMVECGVGIMAMISVFLMLLIIWQALKELAGDSAVQSKEDIE